jgi:uncharacterized surface protein with fasciclin (FAS1) repeats
LLPAPSTCANESPGNPVRGTAVKKAGLVVCGNVQTANATVYIINTVLMPPSS